MSTSDPHNLTHMLRRAADGDEIAASRLMPMVYDDLHRIAAAHFRRETPGHTLQPTALVHEAFLKLVQQEDVDWKSRTHFFAICAQSMRRILVDHARTKGRVKRGGGLKRIQLTDDVVLAPGNNQEDLLDVDAALDRLAELDPRQAKIVELRFFGGLSVEEVASVLRVSKSTVEKEWTMVRAWLRRELSSKRCRP